MDNRNILVAFDGSASAFKAVEYVGVQFSGLTDMMITLFYVVPNVPPQFWDDGHILTPQERQDRQGVIDNVIVYTKSDSGEWNEAFRDDFEPISTYRHIGGDAHANICSLRVPGTDCIEHIPRFRRA